MEQTAPANSVEMNVKAQDLRKGDFLLGSRRTIEWAGQRFNTPPRKVTVHIMGNHGVYRSDWNKTTMIRIRRPIAEAP